MSKKLKLCLALILSLAVLAQYSFSPQALYAYGLDNTDNTVQTEEAVADDKPAADEQKATEPAEPTDATEATEAEKPAAADPADGNQAPADGEEKDADKQDVKYPAVSFSETAGDVKVNISASEGALPEGTTVEVASVKASKVQDAVDDLIDDGKIIKAVDITFKDKDGKEIEPNEKVSVTFESKAFGKLDDASVVHIQDNGKAEAVKGGNVDGNKATFKSDEFSVYVVVETVVPRLTVTFKNGSTDVATMIIKKADTAAEVEKIIYDPGAGTIPNGQVFKGWMKSSSYTSETPASDLMTIAQVRTDAMSKAAALTNADGEVTYYAAFAKHYTVTYKSDDESPITVGTATVELPAAEPNAEYTVNMGYPVDDSHYFEGWIAADSTSEGNIVGYPTGATKEVITTGTGSETIYYYPNTTKITIKGDVDFTVRAPEGNWLVFDENGKGATYTAPQFVLKGSTTEEPSNIDSMARNGYTFGGWYDSVEHAAAHAADPEDETGKFEFGGTLSSNTTIYASWIPNATAGYTVVFWTQNLDRDGYEVAGSYPGTGTVGQNIPYTVVPNDAETYVTGVGSHGHYTGFCLTEASENQKVEITPEGDAVLNLYYDRIKYNFKFYLYRELGTGNDQFSYPNNSDTGSNLDTLVTWNNSDNHPSIANTEKYSLQSESQSFGNRNYTYYYFTIEAYYGQDISGDWPKYSDINGADGRVPVSYVMMVGTQLKPNPTSEGSGTVKGIVSVMNENILGKTNNADGNYVMVRFPNNYYNWRYHIWLETVAGEEYETTHVYNGKTYYEETVMEVRSSNTQVYSQNQPEYNGFDFVAKRGRNWDNDNYWQEDGSYHLNFVYDRQQYKISYFDGDYVDGDNNEIQNRSTHLLHESEVIAQGATIPNEYKNYKPTLPDSEKGYVFEGWYLDEGCTVPYKWDKMTIGGIKVYAKWRQIQYRVFLNTNVPKSDSSLSWGKDEQGQDVNQALSFRISYGKKVSTPTGTRDGYKFLGWYKDPGFETAFNADAYVLNEQTVTESYDKTVTNTDPENRPWAGPWEDSTIQNAYNSDLTGWDDDGDESTAKKDRYWITKKLNLYANWSKVLDGADGMNVVYNAKDGEDLDGNPVEGSGAPTDTATYIEGAKVSASAAAKAPEGYAFDHWVVETWKNGAYTYDDESVTRLPGQTFTLKESDAKVDSNSDGTKTYTVQLLAIYKKLGKKTPTHIYWYKNDGTDQIYHKDENIQINVGVDIYGLGEEGIPERDGFTFKGWTKTPGGTTADFLIWDGSKFTDADGNTAEQVAADEKNPIEDLYAVWEEKAKITVTVEHYLVGTETKIAADTSLQVTDGSTLDPSTVKAATTFLPAYQGYSFTKKSTDPSESFVVSANNKTVKLYYTLPLTIKAENKSKTYDATPLAGEYTADGALADDKAGIEEQLAGATAPSITNVEDSPFKYEAPAVKVPSYYDVETKNGNLTINPAPLTISADNKSKQQGQADPELTATVTGLKGSDKAPKYSLSRVAGEAPGKYAIIVSNVTASGIKVGNYDVTTKNGTLTITGTTPVPPTPPTPPTPPPGGPVVTGGPAPAAPATIVDTPTPTTIVDEPAPKAVEAYWALINLLCAIATALLSLIMLIRYFGKRKEEEEITDPATGELVTRDVDEQRGGLARIASLIPAIGGIIAFILTEDMSLPMAMVDKWTILMIVILAIQVGVGIVAKLRDNDDEEEDEEAMA